MIEKIGVIGAGRMGCGIAHVCAVAGLPVHVVDTDPETLPRVHVTVRRSLDQQVMRALLEPALASQARSRITTGTDITGVAGCGLVIETVPEDEAVKRDVLRALAALLPPEAIIASNTSSMSITRLGTMTGRPGRFIGLHFMNPAPVMELVEVIRGIATNDATYTETVELVKRLGKVPALSQDFPAFMVNRILMPMINEAIYTLYEGVGSVEAIDTALRLGAHHPMGPLQLADYMGLDICLAVMQVLYEGLSDSKYRPCPLLVKYVEAGWLGRKTGRGFYDYSQVKPVPTR